MNYFIKNNVKNKIIIKGHGENFLAINTANEVAEAK